MTRPAAKGKTLWPALMAAAALLLTAPQALASRTASSRADLLTSPALDPPAVAQVLAPAYVPQGFELLATTDPHPRQLALFPDLEPAPAIAAGEKLASGLASWEPQPNLQRMQAVVAETWWVREHLGSVDSPNLYQAFGLDPHNNTDPLGLWKCPAGQQCAGDPATYEGVEYPPGTVLPCPQGETCIGPAPPAATPEPGGHVRGEYTKAVLKCAGNALCGIGTMYGRDPAAASHLPSPSRHDTQGLLFEPATKREATIMVAADAVAIAAPAVLKALSALRSAEAQPRPPVLDSRPRVRGYQVEDFMAEEYYTPEAGYVRTRRGTSTADFRDTVGLEKIELKSLDPLARTYQVEDLADNGLLDRMTAYRDQLLRYDRTERTPINVLEVRLTDARNLTFNQDVVLRKFAADALQQGVIVEVFDLQTGALLITPTPPGN